MKSKKFMKYEYLLCQQKYNLAIKRHGFDALKIINQLLQLHNINYWLYAGTLLGIIRDKGFIVSDTDIDIGVWYDTSVQKNLSGF